MAGALKNAAQLHGRSVGAEVRAAIAAHLAATAAAMNDNGRGRNPGRVETPLVQERERVKG